ncbi:MAG: DUF6088 family protein [Gammaproteobacteria bacterium]|nr:DUF6088 family protein [Gammaproteobacteria bacterium]
MAGVADRILKRVAARGRGQWVCTPKDFLDLGSRPAIDQALSRLVKAGKLRRLSQGLYDMPRVSRVLNRAAPPNIDAAIAAIARRDGVRIMPAGLAAANQLGLTNAVPAKSVYVTDGSSRQLKIDGRTIQFRHAGPGTMQWSGRPAASVAQALRWLGPSAVKDVHVISILKRTLPDTVKRDLSRNSRGLPGWALALVRELETDSAIAA